MASFSRPTASAVTWGSRLRPGTTLRPEVWMVIAGAPIVLGLLSGMILGIGTLTIAAAGVALVAALLSPPVGLLLLAFMGSLKSPEIFPTPGLNLALVGATLMGCVYRLPIDRPRIVIPAPLLPLLAFYLYAFVQQLPELVAGYAGEEPHRIGYQFIQLSAIVGLAIAAGYVLSGRRPSVVLATCLAAAGVASLLAIATYDVGVGSSPLSGLLAETDDGTRAVGPFGNPNYFGHFLATAIAAAVGWAMVTRERRQRWLLAGFVALASTALALSLSRGAIAALLVGLACLGILRNRAVGSAMIVVGVIAAVVIYPAFVEWRLGSATSEAYLALNSSDAGRLDAVLAGPQLFLSEPLFGVGFGQYSVLSARFTETHVSIGSHNWYMNVLAEQGLVGAVLWLLLLISAVAFLRSRPAPARLVGVGVLVTFAAGSLFTTQPASFQTSALPVIVLAAALVGNWTSFAGKRDPAPVSGAGGPGSPRSG